MRIYETWQLKIIPLETEDVITASGAEFTDAETGDNGAWFPGVGH